MLDRQTLLTLFEDTAPVIVFNLDFLPDDKLDWKPAPDAKSALGIVNHLTEYLGSLAHRLNGESETPDAFVPATSRDQAKALLSGTAHRFALALRSVSAQRLREQYNDEMPLSLGWMVTAATIDTIHHAGQIAYIQTLLGDNELHFDESKMPAWTVS